ncbi:hypothetical protein B0T25DRAFT_178037 [Lasiosphaeria hispida]|uniref:NACHT-NTPase and P-loop NTPases N-terminal domain-containing protein n=1 Tax=Lasiosphaeria hispida TaxID=260671 RepID=A0AAJ0HP40_9PEZI|nr:hypothetical protein B0T25DRAFT_178037 [Lasiosphaeria hispida]
MEVGVTFGALGDFISIVFIVKDIISALSDIRGSSKSYGDLVESLHFLTQTLQEVDQVHCGQPKNDRVRQTALRIIGKVRQCLHDFEANTAKYQRSLSQGGSGNTAKDIARKLQWKLFEEEGIDKFRSEVSQYGQSLGLLLLITTFRMTQSNYHEVTQGRSSIQDQTEAGHSLPNFGRQSRQRHPFTDETRSSDELDWLIRPARSYRYWPR